MSLLRYLSYILILLAPVILYLCKFGLELPKNSAEWDHLGSYLGGVYSGLALLALIYQIEMVKREQYKQDFDRQLFFLLEQNNLKINALTTDCIDKIYNLILTNIIKDKQTIEKVKDKVEHSEQNEIYSQITGYFAHLILFIKFLSNNRFIEDKEKGDYFEMLKNSIPIKVLFIFAYHLKSRANNCTDIIKSVESYAMLENMKISNMIKESDKNALFNKGGLLEFAPGAFGENPEYIKSPQEYASKQN